MTARAMKVAICAVASGTSSFRSGAAPTRNLKPFCICAPVMACNAAAQLSKGRCWPLKGSKRFYGRAACHCTCERLPRHLSHAPLGLPYPNPRS